MSQYFIVVMLTILSISALGTEQKLAQKTHSPAKLIANFSTSNVKPWGYISPNNQEKGLLIDFNNALATAANIEINNHIIPYPRAIKEIENGKTDFAVMFKSQQAQEIGISLGEVTETKILLIALSGTPEIKDLSQLGNQLVGFIRGSKYGDKFDNNTQLKKVALGSMKQGIELLLKGRIAGMASTDITFYAALKEMNIPSTKVKPIMTISSMTGHLYFSKASPNTHLILPLKHALNQLRDNGTLKQIFSNFQ